MSPVTRLSLPAPDPRGWKDHRFGLPPSRWSRLRDRAFWITGAGTGIGRALSLSLAAAQAHVFLTGRRAGKLEESMDEARSLEIPTDRMRPLPADVTRDEAIATACDAVRSGCPSLEGLVHCAALPEPGSTPYPLLEGDPETWDRIMRINVRAGWRLTRDILPHMLVGGGARVLLFSSGAGWASTPGFGRYNVSKAAVNALGGSLAAECSARHPDRDIQINVLQPGEVRSEMNQGSDTTPFAVTGMALALLSHPAGGPNGRYFHRDGRHLSFGDAPPHPSPLFGPESG